MDRFVKLTLFVEGRKDRVERWFNLRYVRHVEPSTLSVWLQGSHSPIKVTKEDMKRILSVIDWDSREEVLRKEFLESAGDFIAENNGVDADEVRESDSAWDKFKKKLGV